MSRRAKMIAVLRIAAISFAFGVAGYLLGVASVRVSEVQASDSDATNLTQTPDTSKICEPTSLASASSAANASDAEPPQTRTLERAAPDLRTRDSQISINATLDAALARRLWTDEDARNFRIAAVNMDPAERQAALLRLIVAINEGQLRVTTRGAPF